MLLAWRARFRAAPRCCRSCWHLRRPRTAAQLRHATSPSCLPRLPAQSCFASASWRFILQLHRRRRHFLLILRCRSRRPPVLAASRMRCATAAQCAPVLPAGSARTADCWTALAAVETLHSLATQLRAARSRSTQAPPVAAASHASTAIRSACQRPSPSTATRHILALPRARS